MITNSVYFALEGFVRWAVGVVWRGGHYGGFLRFASDNADTISVSSTQRAWAVTGYVPALDHAYDAFADDDQFEVVPSPQSKRYSMLCPRLLLEPPVL